MRDGAARGRLRAVRGAGGDRDPGTADNLGPISLLAFGLVLLTMAAVAVVAHATIEEPDAERFRVAPF